MKLIYRIAYGLIIIKYVIVISMKYNKTLRAKFIDRPNRFVANVELNGEKVTVHVKNTGRCKELLIPGVDVILSDSENPDRKYRYDLITVWKESVGWINIDSQAPNYVMKEWLSADNEIFSGLSYIKPEYTYGDSRIDFYLEKGDRKIFIEVKGCTLEIDGQGYFPDAPTERGVKHLRELIKAHQDGYECYIAYVIAMNGIRNVEPNRTMHPEFGRAMDEAKAAGINVLFMECDVKEDELRIIRGSI